MKNHQGCLEDSEDESDAKIFSLPDEETGQQSAPHIQLEMPRQSQQWNAERVLVENYFGIMFVPLTRRSKFSVVLSQLMTQS